MTSFIATGTGTRIDPVGGNAEKSGAGEGDTSKASAVEEANELSMPTFGEEDFRAGPGPASTGMAEASTSVQEPTPSDCGSPGSRVDRTFTRLFRGNLEGALEASRQGRVDTFDPRCWPVWAYVGLLLVLVAWSMAGRGS